MTFIRIIILLSCLLQGFWCRDWTATMPQSITVLGGSCAAIPCRFTLASGWDMYLDDTCKAIWKRGSWSRVQVFDSSLTGPNANFNLLQGNLTGNLNQMECTTIFNNVPYNYDDYYFRLDCGNRLKFNYQASVSLAPKDKPPRPTIIPSVVEVVEGAAVSLSCLASVPCPTLPPTLTWSPSLGQSVEKLRERQDRTEYLTSSLNFTASRLHHSQKLSCSALYKRQVGSDISSETSLTINVLYAPRNTTVTPTGPVLEGSSVTLTCSNDANPEVRDYIWYKSIGAEVSPVGFRKMFTTQLTAENNRFQCEAKNLHGSQTSPLVEIDVQFPPKDTSLSVSPLGNVVEGNSLTLTCNSNANPAVNNYTWYKVDSGDDAILGTAQILSIDRADGSHDGEYYCEARNKHGGRKSTIVQLHIEYPPKNTSVSVRPSGPVPESTSVTLTCSSHANPAVENYTWQLANGQENGTIGGERDYTLNVTRLSSQQIFCKAWNLHGSENSPPASIDVTFAPVIQTSSRCVRILSQIRCSCESDGNPPPSLVWELAGDSVNHSAETHIREEPVGRTGLRSIITLRGLGATGLDTPSLVCLSTNAMGFDSQAFNVTSAESQLGFDIVSLVIGLTVGAVGMMVLCVLLQLLCSVHRKRKTEKPPQSRPEEKAELLVTNAILRQDSESVYVNKDMLLDHAEGEEDTLHYADIDIGKLKERSGVTAEEREIRGLASVTAEYAVIRLHPTEEPVRANAAEQAVISEQEDDCDQETLTETRDVDDGQTVESYSGE